MAEVHDASVMLQQHKPNAAGAIAKYPWNDIKPGKSIFFKQEEIKLATLKSLAYKRGQSRKLKFVVLNSYNGYYEVGIAATCHKDQSEVCKWPECNCIELSKGG